MRSGSGVDAVALVEERLELAPRSSSTCSTRRRPRPTSGRRRPSSPRSTYPVTRAVAEQHVGRAVVAVADDQILVRRARSPRARPGRRPGSGGACSSWKPAGSMSSAATRRRTWSSARPMSKRNGHHSSPTASWKARSPRPSARDERAQVVTPDRVGGVAPGQRLGQQDRRRRLLLQRDHVGDRQVGRGPDHPLGLGAQCGVAAAGVDLGEAHRPSGPVEPPGRDARAPAGRRASAVQPGASRARLGRRRGASGRRARTGCRVGRDRPAPATVSATPRGGRSARGRRRDAVRAAEVESWDDTADVVVVGFGAAGSAAAFSAAEAGARRARHRAHRRTRAAPPRWPRASCTWAAAPRSRRPAGSRTASTTCTAT